MNNMFFSAHATGVLASPNPRAMTMRAPGPALEFSVLLNERGDAFFEKDSFCLSEEDIRAYKSTVVRDCGQGYVLAPCTSKEAMNMPFGGLAMHCEEYGFGEHVPVIDIPNQTSIRSSS